MSAERKPEFFAGKGIKVGIIGCGYVGLPLALRFADEGQKVTGFDLDKVKIVYFEDIGAQITAMQSGTVDMMQTIPLDSIERSLPGFERAIQNCR